MQDAVIDSIKDVYRISESLNAMKRRLIDRQDEEGADRVERFQEGLDVPYVRMTGAAAVFVQVFMILFTYLKLQTALRMKILKTLCWL